MILVWREVCIMGMTNEVRVIHGVRYEDDSSTLF